MPHTPVPLFPQQPGSMGKSKADERPYWTLEEFQKFSDAIMDKRDSRMAFQILFWTGMRIGELLALQVKDVNFEDGTIRVDRRLVSLNQSSVGYVSIYLQILDQSRRYWQMGGKNTWKK